MSTDTLLQRRERLLGQRMPLFYSEPVHIVRGNGIWLYDASGKQYMDLYNNVPCVGHANPRVAAAMRTQAGTLNVHSRYLHEAILDYAERLTDLHAETLARAVFCCTGTEVRRLSNARRDREGNPEIRTIPYPQRYRPLDPGVSEAELTELHLGLVHNAIADFARHDIGKLEELDRSFDLDFWQAQTPKARFDATWDLIVHYAKVKGIDVRQLRLQRSVESFQRQAR